MSASSTQAEPQMNATPLIDVLLVLLTMLIFTLPIATHMVKLNLPHGGPQPPPSTVYLDVGWDGDVYWNGTYLASLDELAPRFASIAVLENPPSLMIVPDKRAPYERVAQVLAAAQRARVQKLGVSPVPD
ncbi:MAG TPA: biopolymer transporter ExbD [Steroidobacteraceae bacterium]|nr:biopolymer transporter ExbD [Steroidobacteraceae bacterium]